MDLTTHRPVAFDPTRFGTHWHEAIRNAPDRLLGHPLFERDAFSRTFSQDLRSVARGVKHVADCTLNPFVGTGAGSDHAQIKRGIVGPYKDGMIEGNTIALTHGLRAFATFWGIGASVTVGLANRWRGQTAEQTTEHFVYWAKSITDGWAASLAGRSARFLTAGEEVFKAVTAVVHGAATGAALVIALVPATVHACMVGASSYSRRTAELPRAA